MKLNVDKCKIIKFYRVRSPINQLYTLGNKSFVIVDMVNDLGVLFDRTLCFGSHIENIINKYIKILVLDSCASCARIPFSNMVTQL